MEPNPSLRERLRQAVDRERLLGTATRLIAVPSRTGEAGAAADCLADILRADGVQGARPEAGYPVSPAVACRYSPSPQPSPSRGEGATMGRTLQFNGHLDTV